MTSDSAPSPSRYVVGLDLGTTNSALAYVDTAEAPWKIRTFATPQSIAPGQWEARETLPSFHYQPATGEFPPHALRLPWQKSDPAWTAGHFARDHGALAPGRLVNSAKSWLCHSGVDRTAELLPWHGAPDVDRLSPVTVSARYLLHFREAWDAQFPEHPLAEQDFVLTLPASFDEVARELTVRAAQQAGLRRVALIEEPQAAFYAWIAKHADDWDRLVSPGQKILVCDVGGGTTDFTLIRVRKGSDGTVQFHRVAVGEHLILGGDNFDLALAHHLEQKLKGNGKLEPRQWSMLVRSCRQVKEVLLGNHPPEQWTLSLPGAGSRLIGGGLQTPVTRQEVEELIVEGFFPSVSLESKPATGQSGFQEFGLPYAPDAAITRYLAAFLSAHRHVALEEGEAAGHDPARPDIVLFNGGVFTSSQLQERLVDAIRSWFRTQDPGWSPIVLDHERLDLAVAKGAAYYGMVRRGLGVRIAAGLARTYYIGVEGAADQPSAAICLMPAGAEPNTEVDLEGRQFQLLVSQPIEFPLYVSSVRLTDKPGDVVTVDREQISALPPIRTVLKLGKSAEAGTVAVTLKARLTEIGTLDLWCSEVAGKRTWKLLFDVRAATRTEVAAHESAAEGQGFLEESARTAGETILRQTFTPAQQLEGRTPLDPAGLMKGLVEALGLERHEWPTSLLREIWETLFELEPGRRISSRHEARWLNVLGYALRPGYGLAMDDWRVGETWRLLNGKLVHADPMCRAEWWILWRRIAGGLTAGQQQALAGPLIGTLRQATKPAAGKNRGGAGFGTHELAEMLRFVGSCELLNATTKEELGDLLLASANRPHWATIRGAALWAVGRLGARRPVYGPLNSVLGANVAERWLDRVMTLEGGDAMEPFAAMQLARLTGDRYRDIADAHRERVLKWMERLQAPKNLRRLVREVGTLEEEEQGLVFGEALPKGLRIL